MSKRKRDPNAPKRACSAYIFFSNATREATKAEIGENASIGDIAKAMGVKWGKLSDSEKAPFVKKSDADKARYAKERAEYERSGKAAAWAASGAGGGNKRKKKDPNAPKRATTAYFFFMAEVRDETKKELGEKATIGDIAKAIGVKWGKLSDAQKAPYKKMNEKDKERYAKEKAQYEANK